LFLLAALAAQVASLSSAYSTIRLERLDNAREIFIMATLLNKCFDDGGNYVPHTGGYSDHYRDVRLR
jgi:hypothetical protein